jgi:hypothetical protein
MSFLTTFTHEFANDREQAQTPSTALSPVAP